jgi:autotransporter-associated beta strand protein
LIAAALAFAHSAQAGQQRYWTGEGDGEHWSDPLNWIPRSPPESGDDLVIEKPGEFTSTSMVNDLVGLSIHSMSFSGLSLFTTDWYLDGNDLTLTGDITCIGGYDQDIHFDCGVTLGQSVTVLVNEDTVDQVATFRFNGPINLNGNTLQLMSRTHGIFRISSTIIGEGNVRVVNQDTSDVALAVFGGASPNTFSGALMGSSAPGAQTCRLSFDQPGGDVVTEQLAIGDGCEVVLQRSGQIGDNATVSVTGSGHLLLNGHSETIGNLFLTNNPADTVSALVDATGTILSLTGGVVSWTASDLGALPTIKGTLNLPAGLHIFDTFSAGQFWALGLQAQVTGPGGLIKSGNAALSLTSSNSFTGDVAVSQGILDVYDPHALGSTAGSVTLFDGSITLRNVFINDKVLFVRGTQPVTPNTVGSLLSCNGVGGWHGRIELDTNLVVYSTDLCIVGGPVVGPGGFEFLGSRNQLVDAAILPNPYTYTGTTRALCELLVVSAGNPFHGPVIVGGSGPLVGPSVQMQWANTINSGLPKLTLYTNGWANLNGRIDTWSQVIFNGGHISTGTGRVAIGDVIVNPTNATAIIDGNLQLSSTITRFAVSRGSASVDLMVNAVVSDGVNVAGIDKTGDGEMDLGLANTYRGATLVEAGTLGLLDNNSLGATSQGTTVLSGATVGFGVQVNTVLEPFTIAGLGVGGTKGALVTVGDVWINTDISLNGAAAIRTDGTSSEIQVNNVSGTGPLTKLGSGRLVLRGNANNTYSGDTRVTEGILDLAKPTGTASVPGHLIIGTSAAGFGVPSARVVHRASFTIVGSVTVNAGGLWDLTGAAEGFSIPDLQGRPPLTLNNGGSVQTGNGICYLPVGGDIVVNPGFFGSSFISGQIGLDAGAHHLIVSKGGFSTFGGPDCDLTATISETSVVAEIDKDGDGTLRLSAANTYRGPTIVNAGTVIVDGSQPQSSARVFAGRLQGSGTVGQIELLGPTAVVSPGTGPGILTCADFNIGAVNRGFLQIDLNGTGPGTFDQINARGTVKLTGITLSATLNYASATNDQFVIINNDGTDPVVDTFTGLPQNAHFYIGGQQFTVSYTGGSGNDVVLTRIPTPPRPVLTIERLQPASVRLLWPTNATGFVLQANTNLSTTSWTDPLLPSSILETNNAALDLTTNSQRFYRLVHP